MIPNEPQFTTLPQNSGAGDFLGMGAVGERLYTGVFPGLNNAVRHIRPYAAICWMIQKVNEEAFKSGAVTPSQLKNLTDQGIWKIQLLLNWAAYLNKEEMYPGVERFRSDQDKVDLCRSTWPDIKISFWDAVWYRPGLLNGLRLVNEGSGANRGTFDCTDAGKALADAYDKAVVSLEMPTLVKWLSDPNAFTCTRKTVVKLDPILRLSRPSKAEQTAFLRQYALAEFDGAAADLGHTRRRGLLLALRSIRALEEEDALTSVDNIRHTMATGITPGNKSIDLAGAEDVQLKWSILQMRLLQRLALENLLNLVEWHVHKAECEQLPRGKTDIADAIAEYFGADAKNNFSGLVGFHLDSIKGSQRHFATIQAAGFARKNGFEHFRFIDLKEKLRRRFHFSDKGDRELCAQSAVWALLVCAVDVENQRSRKGAQKMLEWDADKLSLMGLNQAAYQHQDALLSDFARFLVERQVILQHFNVASARTAQRLDGRQRFIFTNEREGLARIANVESSQAGDVGETGDVLFHALLLLENCAVLEHIPDVAAGARFQRFRGTFTLTSARGSALLDRLSEKCS